MERPIIDSHWHLYICEDEQGRDFCEVMDALQKQYGLKALNICSIPIYQELGPAQNLLAALYKLHNPTAYAYGGIVYPTKPFQKPMPPEMDPLSQYRELMQIGFDGIKMLETKPLEQKQYGILIDDEYFDGLFAACEQDATPMIWHVADPSTFWDLQRIPERFLQRGWFYGDGTYMSHEEIYGQVYRVLERHPRLKATFAHFFFLSENPGQLEKLFETYAGISIDITPGAEMYGDFRENRDAWRDFFIRYADRIMLGTDTSVNGGNMDRFYQRYEAVRDFLTTDREVTVITETCRGLALPPDICDKILCQNFEAAAGKTPKPVDTNALKRYVEKYLHLITDKKLSRYIQDALRDY